MEEKEEDVTTTYCDGYILSRCVYYQAMENGWCLIHRVIEHGTTTNLSNEKEHAVAVCSMHTVVTRRTLVE